MANPLWDYEGRQRIFVYLTPAVDSAKVLVSIYTAEGTDQIVETERYVWSTAMRRSLYDDVSKFVADALAVAEVVIMDRQSMMDGDALSTDELESPST